MGNVLSYLHNDQQYNMRRRETVCSTGAEVDNSTDLSSDTDDNLSGTVLAEDSESIDESSEVHRFRLPCGKIVLYSELQDHGTFGKAFKKINWDWGTGPYREWESMIVDEDAIDYKYLTPYEKDINGHINKDDDGNLSVCKNCEAYATWKRYGDIMIRTGGCTNCINDNYRNKIIRIQNRWRSYTK